jgi:hypothetical protein
MATIRLFAIAMIVTGLLGCGLRVPPIDDLGDRIEGQRFVQAVLINITCELRAPSRIACRISAVALSLDGFGIQSTLTITYDEKGALAPGVTWTPPSPANSVFSLGAGLTASQTPP